MERVAGGARGAQGAAGGEGKVSFNDIVIKAVAMALRQHPACNAWWQDDHIRYWNEVHVGMAVAVEDGLITPVIRHADSKIAAGDRRRVARPGRPRAGAASSSPRSTPAAPSRSPTSACSTSTSSPRSSIRPRPASWRSAAWPRSRWCTRAQVAIRRRMRLTMSCDHRVIDGATGAQFLKTLKAMLENPLALVW